MAVNGGKAKRSKESKERETEMSGCVEEREIIMTLSTKDRDDTVFTTIDFGKVYYWKDAIYTGPAHGWTHPVQHVQLFDVAWIDSREQYTHGALQTPDVNLSGRDALAAGKEIIRLEAALDKLADRLGTAQDVADNLGRLASILKIEHVGIPVDGSWCMGGTRYDILTVREACHKIRAHMQERRKPAESTAA